jgi:hypothetical protein
MIPVGGEASAAAGAGEHEPRLWEQGAKDELPRAETWLEQAGPAITERLTHTTSGRIHE